MRIGLLACLACVLSHSPAFALDAHPRFEPSVHRIAPHENAQHALIARLIEAVPGDIIQLEAGRYEFDTELNLNCSHITIRGAGPQQTVLSFKQQQFGSEGLTATGDAFVIENLAVEDTIGNAIKVLGADGATFRNVRVEWTRGPDSDNGAYGIYPVQCKNVLIDHCEVYAASDAGIYVGQCQDVIVRHSKAERNVAGIEIENTVRADVYENIATNNTGGILVFDLPGLQVTNGGHVRVFDNKVFENNLPNFAPGGTMVAGVPTGTGVMVMATDEVEIFRNEIRDHQTTNVSVVSFLITERKIKNATYDPFSESISIHDNLISGGGKRPAGRVAELLTPVVGKTFPDIFYDGIVNPAKLVDGSLPKELSLRLDGNRDQKGQPATFANFRIGDFSLKNVRAGSYKVDRDVQYYVGRREPLPAVRLQPHSSPETAVNSALTVYHSAPRRLSEWKLFYGEINEQQPAEGVLPYELNTALFSDATAKHRFIRLPDGESMEWDDETALRFPIGTAIAKTFGYPHDARDPGAGERLLETRIELRKADGWYGYSYIWNDRQSDAELALGGGVIEASWIGEDGEPLSNRYQVPNANQCLSCHAQNVKYEPLGPTARNLNRPDGQLNDWITARHVTGSPDAADRPRLAAYTDSHSGTLDDRARAWLEVNCAHCHNPQGTARTSGLDLRVVQNDPAKFGVWKSPVATGRGSGGHSYDIVPGRPDASILMHRIESEEPGVRMPNLSRNMIHDESARLIRDWIAAMPSEDRDAAAQP